MGPRRSHTKSRHGCRQCKERRIKCDEKPPRCSNCTRRQIECDFAHRPPPSSNHATPTLHLPALTSSAPNQVPSPESVSDQSLTRDLAITIPPSGLNVGDLELLHHYTTVTYKTLPSGSHLDLHDLWQTQVVQLGFQHEFLLRGILAVSALHLRYLRPNQHESLAFRATSHQSVALAAFHDALNRVDPSNCVAIFAFSCFIVVLAFAAPRSPESTGFQQDVFDWFHLIRGCNSVLQTQWETVSQSFLAPLVRTGMIHEAAGPHRIPDSDRVTDLLRLCASERLAQDRESANAYALAIHELLNTYAQVSILMERQQDFVPMIFVWPISIPQRYLDMLRDQQPKAMIILAHYSALLQRIDDQWYMHGWARYLISQIDAALSEEWQHWLAWPRVVAGLDYSR